MIEKGVVRAVKDGVAQVEILPTSREACASCNSCEVREKRQFLEIEAGPELEPGRWVVLDVTSPGELGPTVVVFLLPVVALIAGAIVGGLVPGWTGWTFLSKGSAGVLGSLALLVPAVLLIRWYDRSVNRRSMRPKVVRIESRA